MSGMVALKAAYAVVWGIELAYVWYLVSRYRRVSKELKELRRSN